MSINQISKKHSWSQTEKVKMCETSTQKPENVNSPTQTTWSTIVDQTSLSFNPSLTKGLSRSKEKEIAVDYHRLHRFLHRSVPLIEVEIRDSCQFDQLSSSWLNYWNGASGKGIHCERRLNSKILDDLASEIKSSAFASNQIISGITWNSPQTTLAVVYKASKHSDWCTHRTFLLLWNLFSRKNDSHSSKPMYACEVDNCVTNLIAHPFKGSMYVLGCYNGSLMVIDTRLLDISSSSTDFLVDLPVSHRSLNRGDLHLDSIIGLHWLKLKRSSVDSDEDHLISFSADGLIIRWKLESNKTKLLQPLDLFNIILSDLPKSMGLKETNGHFYKGVPVLSTTWEPDNEVGFIVGCEAGAVFRCSLNANLRTESVDDSIRPSGWLPIKNPIVMAYVPHRAGVTNVDFSPNLRNIFISSGADNEFRVWDVFQSKPLFVVHCDVNIVSTIWLFARPVIFTVQDDGFICVYSINIKSKPKLIHRFSLEERKSARMIWKNLINRDDQMAITDENNTIYLYSIHLTSENIIPDQH